MWESFLASDPWLRFPIYALFGWLCEVVYTAICDLINPSFLASWNVHSKGPSTSIKPEWVVKGRDSRLVGYTFLWMFPIYGCMVFFEPLVLIMKAWPWFLRGIVYMLLVWIAEYVSGWIIKKITGRCPWDYSASRFSFHGYIRWDFAPVWFGFGFLFEYVYPRLLALTPHIKNVF